MKPLYRAPGNQFSPRRNPTRSRLIVVCLLLVVSAVLYTQLRGDEPQNKTRLTVQPANQNDKGTLTDQSASEHFVKAGKEPKNSLLPVLNTSHIEPPDIRSESAILIDADSGLVLYQKNAHKEREIASLTKIMTAMLVYEMGSSADTYTASENSSSAGGSELYLAPGEKLSGKDMFYALMLRSANDVSIALAEAIAGSESKFVDLMNDRATSLGLRNTRFFNPHGLDKNKSTAYEMAVISKEAMKDPFFRQVVGTSRYEIPWPGNPYPRSAINHNRLLAKYPEVKGIKTGLTNAAGYCLSAAGEKNGVRIITVVLGADTANQVDSETMALFDYAFKNFSNRKLAKRGDSLISETVTNAPMFDVKLTVTTDVTFLDIKVDPQLAVKYTVTDKVTAPITIGEPLGKMLVYDDAALIASVPLVSEHAVSVPNIWEKLSYFLKNL